MILRLSRTDTRSVSVLALFRGEHVAEVSAQYQMGRSALYKFRQRALAAVHQALVEQRRGPRRSHNRIAADREAQVVTLCQRHPSWSSYAVHRRFGTEAPSPRTIQRIRARHGLVRFSKRAPAMRSRRKLSSEAHARIAALITEKPYLGPQRMAWDLQNSDQLTISTSIIKTDEAQAS